MQISIQIDGWNAMCKRYAVTACLALAVFLTPFVAEAVQVDGISLQKLSDGDVVTIRADAPLSYELFDLTAPSRLVVSLPGASLKKGLEPLHNDYPGVNSVFPVVSAAGVRLEIGMDRALAYRVEEKGHDLILHFSAIAVTAKKNGAAAVLKDINIRDSGSVTDLIVRGDHMNASHDVFVTNQGRTMILDFWGATSMLPKEHYAVATQRIRNVTVGHARGRVRLVVDLVKGGQEDYQIDASGKRMVVQFGDVTARRKAAVVQVEGVHFQPDDRVAHLQIRTNVPNPIVNIYEKKGNVVLDIKKASLAAGQQRTQDVRDFPGPIKQVDAYTVDGQVRIVARLREKVDVSSFQQGNVLTLTLMPKDIAAARSGMENGGKFTYTGRKVTFDFKDIEIQNALKLIAEMSNLNIIMSDDVKGTLTMHLVNVPWDQALDLILSARGLGEVRQGNVMRIAPLSVLQAENDARLKAKKTTANLEPLVTEFISLSFARVTDIKQMLAGAKSSAKTSGAAGTGALSSGLGLSSARGSILVDERTNTLIIHDTQTVINNIKRLIARIDRPEKQVLIAARIIEASNSFSRDLGVRWGGEVNGGSGAVRNTLGSSVQDPLNPNTGANPGGFLVDLPAAVRSGAGGQIGLALGALSNAFNLDLELSAAEADDQIKIVSSPRVVTTNLKKATISQGSTIPFLTVSQNGTNIIFKKATLGLEITPQITAKNSLLLHVLVTKDAPANSSVGGNPIINTKTIETDIFMDNGETIVIGGIYTRDRQKTINGVPGFMRIPILSWLFKKKFRKDEKKELLIFLTPKILESKPGGATKLARSSVNLDD